MGVNCRNENLFDNLGMADIFVLSNNNSQTLRSPDFPERSK
jgi:hypothetical protein